MISHCCQIEELKKGNSVIDREHLGKIFDLSSSNFYPKINRFYVILNWYVELAKIIFFVLQLMNVVCLLM